MDDSRKMTGSEKAFLIFVKVFGILFILAAPLYIYTEDYFALKYTKESELVYGQFARISEIEPNTYSKYGFVNNPSFYISAAILEDEFTTYSGSVKYEYDGKKYAAFFNGLEDDELDKNRRKVPLIIDKDNPEIAALDDWWFNWWIPTIFVGLGSFFYLFGRMMDWVLKS